MKFNPLAMMGNNPLFQVAENMCRERGTSIDEVLGRFGITR